MFNDVRLHVHKVRFHRFPFNYQYAHFTELRIHYITISTLRTVLNVFLYMLALNCKHSCPQELNALFGALSWKSH